MFRLTSLVLFLFAVVFRADSTSEAGGLHLLATKTITPSQLARGVPFSVIYRLYNIGNVTVKGVHLVDSSFSTRHFVLRRGPIDAKWSEIAPGEQVLFSTEIESKPHVRTHNVTAAIVTYSVKDSHNEYKMVMRTSGSYIVQFMLPSLYHKKHSSHVIQWTVYALLVAIVLIGPYHAVLKINEKYNIKANKAQ